MVLQRIEILLRSTFHFFSDSFDEIHLEKAIRICSLLVEYSIVHHIKTFIKEAIKTVCNS